jgi:hypothetical protein
MRTATVRSGKRRRVIQAPEKFQGVFSVACARYEPLMLEAREQLRAIEVPDELQDHFEFGVLAHDQPSFMLLPLMYLDLADRTGGIQSKHRAYLPWFMLSWELVAVIDDAIDRAKRRSGRQTFVDHYGITQLLPFSHFLMSTIIEGAAVAVPESVPWIARSFSQLCGLETIEVATRYPTPSVPTFERLLRYHHEQARGAVSHALDAAMALQGREPFPAKLSVMMGDLMQDVDDVVNVVEHRSSAGENDDLRLGTVTFPLLATLRADPSFAAVLETLWAPYRLASANERAILAKALQRCDEETLEEGRAVHRAVARHGIPATIAKIRADSEACVASAPSEFRAYTADMCDAFLERIQNVSLDGDVDAETHETAANK